MAYVTTEGGLDTLWRWPIAGGAATPLFRFRNGTMGSDFRWSQDGRTIVFSARANDVANLWQWRAGIAELRQMTRFPTGLVGQCTWSPNGATVYFLQGMPITDVVLIRGME